MISLLDTPEATAAGSHKTLRNAGMGDIPWIIENGSREFQGSPYWDFGVDAGKTRQLFESLIVNGQEKSIVLISHSDGKPVGVIAAYAFEPLFSRTKVAIECLWFLLEDYRKGSRARDMMDAYEYWARLINCKFIQYGLLSSSPPSMESLYAKIGATETERIYQKAL